MRQRTPAGTQTARPAPLLDADLRQQWAHFGRTIVDEADQVRATQPSSAEFVAGVGETLLLVAAGCFGTSLTAGIRAMEAARRACEVMRVASVNTKDALLWRTHARTSRAHVRRANRRRAVRRLMAWMRRGT